MQHFFHLTQTQLDEGHSEIRLLFVRISWFIFEPVMRFVRTVALLVRVATVGRTVATLKELLLVHITNQRVNISPTSTLNGPCSSA
jgi:hypothetical protein